MKKKSQVYCLIVAFSVLFVIFLACFIKFIHNFFSIAFGIISLVMLSCLVVSVFHLIMFFQGISVKFTGKSSLLLKEEGKEMFALFIPLSSDQLILISKIDGNNIISFQPDVESAMMYTSKREDKNCKFDVKETCGLLPSKKFELHLDGNYQMIFNTSDFSKLCKPGFCILLKASVNALKIKEQIERLQDFYIRFPRIKNNILHINYGYKKFAESYDDARMILSRRSINQSYDNLSENKVVTLYDVLLHRIFMSCSNNETNVYPMGDSDQERRLWIDKPDGRMALFLLSNFSLEAITGRKEAYLDDPKSLNILNKKITWVKNYIANNGKLNDSNYLSSLFDKLRSIICSEERITYYSLHRNYLLSDGRRLGEAICQDLEDDLDPYIYAIASYQDCEGVDKTCNFIKNLLCISGHEGLIDGAQFLLDDMLCKEVRYDVPCYEFMNIFRVMRKLFPQQDIMWCTGRELIDAARKYILDRYIPCKLGLFNEKFSSMEVGPVKECIFVNNDENVEVETSIEIDDISGTSSVVLGM